MAEEDPRKNVKTPYRHHLEEQIRQRAYERYEARGRQDGHELEDWLTAEQEITMKRADTAAA